MTKQMVIDKFYDEIKESIRESYEEVLRSHGKLRLAVYCWEEDGVQVLEDIHGGNAYLINDKDPDQSLYLIYDVDFGPEIMDEIDIWREDADEEDDEDDQGEDLYETYDDFSEFDTEEKELTEDQIADYLGGIDFDEIMQEIEDNMFYEKVF